MLKEIFDVMVKNFFLVGNTREVLDLISCLKIPFHSTLIFWQAHFRFGIKLKLWIMYPLINSMLYFSVSPNEYEVNHGTEKLDDWLSSKNIEGLDWFYSELVNEEHSSTGYPTLYHGLRLYFKYYPQFQEDSFKKFIKVGGLKYAYDYSKKRADKYGFSSDLSSWSKYTIIRAAMRANDYGHFQKYANEFVTNEFIGDMKYRTLDITDFYEKNENVKKAIEIYEVLLKSFPDSEDILRRIGNAHLSIDNDNEAKKYLMLAERISRGKN